MDSNSKLFKEQVKEDWQAHVEKVEAVIDELKQAVANFPSSPMVEEVLEALAEKWGEIGGDRNGANS